MIFKRRKLATFFSALIFSIPLFSASSLFADTGFYSLAERWEKANSSAGGVSRKDAVDQTFSSALTRSTSYSDSPAIPVPIAITVTLDAITKGQSVINIEQNQSLFVKSNDAIVKFISTEDEKVSMETVDSKTLRILGIGIGTTFVHVWTAVEGRHTFQVYVGPQKFIPSASQTQQLEAAEKSRSFKVSYNNSRSAFYSGVTPGTKKRQSVEFDQNFGLEGDTPYGAVSSHAQTQQVTGKNLLTDAQVALKDGSIGNFKNFNAALGDSRVEPGLMAMPGARIRGADLEHWDKDKRYEWETFYGREQASIIGTLTPGVETKRTQNSYLRGGVLDYKVNDDAKIKGGYFVGSGTSRADELNHYGTGLSSEVHFGPSLEFKPEVDYDSQHYAEREAIILKYDKFHLRAEYRDINKGFESLTGSAGSQGELGYLLEANANVFNNVVLSGSTDIFRDRLIPNPEQLTAYNVHNDLSMTLAPWEGSNLTLSYKGSDDTGRLGPTRQTSYNAQFNQRTYLLGHRGNIFTRYQNLENIVLNNNLSDYIVDQITVGYSMPIFWGINFSISKQINYLNEYNIPQSSTPQAMVYDLDYSNQLGNTPFFADLRFQFRDEENTESTNSFMSGYDTTEFTASLYYRQYENMEIFLTGTFQNYRPESSLITDPRADLQFLTGMHYLFDTKYQWSSVGNFNGFVFKDLNGDGQRQPNEPGLEGVQVLTNGNRHAVTDKQGFYEIKGVAGKKVTLILDTSKIPYGFAPTTSSRQELPIEQGVTRQVNFGVTPRSEITGIIFNDLNGDGKYDAAIDKGIRKIRIKLEDGTGTRTNTLGVYSFPDAIAGKHVVSIDLNTLPEGYLPEGVPMQTITVFEGIRFELNFPIRAVHMITGQLYVDANGNKHLDPGEKTLAGVKILLGGSSILTDKDGYYLFDSVPQGAFELSVDGATLPAGYEKPSSLPITFPEEPATITGADIAVTEKK